jgi:FkbM family methyltransferase
MSILGKARRYLRTARDAERVRIQKKILGNQGMVGLDIGAAEGLQPYWNEYVGAVELYLFEPHLENAARLKELHSGTSHANMFHVLPIGLAGRTGKRTLHVLNTPTGSSLYPIDPESEFVDPGNAYIFPMREAAIEVRNISEVLDEIRLPKVDLIKLDVQGAELEILSGLDEERRKHLLLVEAEVNISGGINRNLSPYKGAPSWAAIDAYCAEAGMRLLNFNTARAYRAKNGDNDYYQREMFDVFTNSPGNSAHVWEADVVYVRDYRSLIESRDAAGLRRLMVALGGYRYFGEAVFIVDEAEKAAVFDQREAEAIRSGLRDWHRTSVRRPWHGRGWGWSMARRLLRRLKCSQLLRWQQYLWHEYPNG